MGCPALHWVFGSVFLNSPHCLVKHPKKFFKKKANKAKVYAPKNKTSKALALI
jgi:hypothetical protein